MSNSLLVSQGFDTGRKYVLTEAEILIGRDTANYICIPEIKVSRRHCRISCIEGQYYLDDLKSSNGTFVNGTRIDRCQLNLGDRISVGETEIVVDSLKGSRPKPESVSVQSVASNASEQVSSGETLIEPESGLFSSRLEEESSYYDRVEDVREASRRFIQVGSDLRFIYHASLATSRNSDRDRMLDEILQLIFDWIAADRGCVFLRSSINSSFEMKFFKCRVELEGFDFRVSKSIISYVQQKRVGVLSARAAQDERWGAQPSILKMKTGEVLCVPIQGRDELLGLIYLDTLVGAGDDEFQRFNEDNLKLLIAMAHQAAVAIENEAYYAALLEKERLAAIGETTGVIAHQVKNMLQGINGGAHLVESGLRSGNVNVISKGWQIVHRNQEQISLLVIDMLMLAQPYAANRGMADINRAIEEAIEKLAPQFAAQSTEFTFAPNPEVQPFSFDQSAITSAVLHIINLSLLACRGGNPGSIAVQVGCRDENAIIVVVNDGELIEISETNDVLDPFGFGDDQKIYGIGLAVSRKIVAGHEGRILLSHPGGKGNKIVIEIPLV